MITEIPPVANRCFYVGIKVGIRERKGRWIVVKLLTRTPGQGTDAAQLCERGGVGRS